MGASNSLQYLLNRLKQFTTVSPKEAQTTPRVILMSSSNSLQYILNALDELPTESAITKGSATVVVTESLYN